MGHIFHRFILSSTLTLLAGAAQAVTLNSASQALAVTQIQSIEFAGTGKWYQFGQAPAPQLSWPQFDVSRYVGSAHFESRSGRVQITRKQTIEPNRERPVPVEQKVDQYVRDGVAWNQAVTSTPGTPTAQPLAADERIAEIWSTPQGFLKGALQNKAKTKVVQGGIEVTYEVGGRYRYVGFINHKNEVEQVKTWADNPVTGDTPYVTNFGHYENIGGTLFPRKIVRLFGGHPILNLSVSDVKVNQLEPIAIPEAIAKNPVPSANVLVTQLAPGVHYFTGGTHHSVVVEQRDHVVLIEAPQNEARSIAVIDQIRALFPSKPLRYVVNTHAHFDHAGGLRTLVDAGATVVTHQENIAYYRQVWSAPRTLNQDRLARSRKTAKFAGFKDTFELNDGSRKIQIFSLEDNTHNDAFLAVYLPNEKILIEGDAYTPLAPGAQKPASPNPFSVNLLKNIERLQLDVQQIAALHGPGVVTLQDLRQYVAP